MDYENKYKKALEKARQLCTYPTSKPFISDLQDLFPELKESEDERIRKALIKYLDALDDDEIRYGVSFKDMRTWLEKQSKASKVEQAMRDVEEKAEAFTEAHKGETSEEILAQMRGEQKPVFEMKTPEESLGIDSDTYNKIVDECIYGEHKPADKVEPKFKVGDEIKTKNEESLIITRIDRWGYWSEDLFICNFDDADNWELVEQKPAWSEEDEKILNGINNYLCSHNSCRLDGFDKWYDWLKSLKDRTIPQPKQGWSEEDKRIINNLISQLGNLYARKLIKEETKDKYVNWLKSLRPKNTWKPSAFHLECIEDAISLYEKHGINAIGLKEILDELKKLKG